MPSGEHAAKPIFLLARTGFVIRNMLLGTFADAVTAHRPLVASVPNPQDERLLSILRDKPITLAPFFDEVEPGPLTRYRKLTRWQTHMYRLRQAERSGKSLEIQTRLFESRPSPLVRAAIRGLVGLGHLLKSAGAMGALENRYLEAVGRWPLTQRWRNLLGEHRPSAVVSTMLTHSQLYHVSFDLPPVLAAYQLGLPIGTLVQSWDNLSSKTSVLPSWVDGYWVWSESMEGELRALNPRVPAERIRIVGSPPFDFHLRPELIEPRRDFVRRLGLDPARPILLIGTGTVVLSPQEPLQITALARAIARELPACQLLIRLHPKDDGSRWSACREKLKEAGAVIQTTTPELHMDSGGFTPPQDFFREQLNAIAHAAIVINTASTLSVDAAILDRPIISIGYDSVPDPRFPEGRCRLYNQSTHFGPLVATGGLTVAHSQQGCLDAVSAYLENPRLHHEGRRRIVKMVAGDEIGRGGSRAAREALALAQRAS